MPLRAILFKDIFKDSKDVIICEDKHYEKISRELDKLVGKEFDSVDVYEQLRELNCEYSYIKIDRTMNYG